MRRTVAIFIIAASLAACSDATTPEDGALTREEALELAERLSASIESPQLMLASSSLTGTFDQVLPCTPSGHIQLAGTVSAQLDETQKTVGLHANLAATPKSCATRLENGNVITLAGDPDIDVTMDLTASDQGLTQFHFTETGAFTWQRGSASGRCTLNLLSELTAATNMIQVTGTFCGFPVSEVFPAGG